MNAPSPTDATTARLRHQYLERIADAELLHHRLTAWLEAERSRYASGRDMPSDIRMAELCATASTFFGSDELSEMGADYYREARLDPEGSPLPDDTLCGANSDYERDMRLEAAE